MIASGRVAYLTRRAPDYGVHVNGATAKGETPIAVDMKRVRQRKRDIVESFRSGSERKLKAAGVDCIMGEGSFADANSLDVKLSDGSGTKSVTADLIFINTGESPNAIVRVSFVIRTDVIDDAEVLCVFHDE
jgi:pyruvate/2-oxoglutarate dehydrogenase complex dihydrolipoamide dehydrogenase (E3) component